MKLIINWTILFFTFYQIPGLEGKPNCLKQNPALLDGEFIYFNKKHLPWTVTEQELIAMIDLFSTRFDSAYIFNGIPNEYLQVLLRSFANFTKSNQNTASVKLYIANHPGYKSNATLNETIRILKEFADMVSTINSIRPGTIAGLTLKTHLKTYEDFLKAAEIVFGPISIANLDIGSQAPENKFKDITDIQFFQKVKYIVIHITINLAIEPKNLADMTVSRCDAYQQDAKFRNMQAKILCKVGYPSYGINSDGTAGNLENFYTFWCRIVENLNDGKVHAKIIMNAAFDVSQNAFQHERPFNPYSTEYFNGWWRRINDLAINESAYIEKITLLENHVNNDTSQRTSNANSCSYIGYQIGLTFFVAISVMLTVAVIRKFPRSDNNDLKTSQLTSEEIQLFELGKLDSGTADSTDVCLLAPYDKSFEIPKSSLVIHTSVLLGKGEHGAVYTGSISNQKDKVAVKTTLLSMSTLSAKQLLTEIKILIHVGKHQNVIDFIGAYTAEKRSGNVSIVLELCELGSLNAVLKNQEQLSILFTKGSEVEGDISQYIQTLGRKWAFEIANGMNHISSKNVIHGDLAARNVLITASGQAKITDFGLSRKLYSYSTYVKKKGQPLPWRWMAPECLKHMSFSTQSDVWAYGITLFEIFSGGSLPYPGMVWDNSFVEVLESGFKNSKPEFCSDHDEYGIMESCWQVVPSFRPTFTTLMEFFEQFEWNSNQYLKFE